MQFNIGGLDFSHPRKKRKTKKGSVKINKSGHLDLDLLIKRKAPKSRVQTESRSQKKVTLHESKFLWDPTFYSIHGKLENTDELNDLVGVPALEAQRHFLYTELKAKISEKASDCVGKKTDDGKSRPKELSGEIFDRWYMRASRSTKKGDVLFPICDQRDVLFKQDLIDFGVSGPEANSILEFLEYRAKQISRKLTQMRMIDKDPSMSRTKDKITLRLGKLPVVLHAAHYEKLKILFSLHGPENAGKNDFHRALFCLLTRYVTACDGGFQSALQEEVFEVLTKDFDVALECFASPLNCRFRRFCSQWPDTDAHFGSLGSFFNFRPTEGSFEANPPFEDHFILDMANHMKDLLRPNKSPLQFIVFIPNWNQTDGWGALRGMAKKYVCIKQADHGYCEGPQHRRETRYRIASFDTAVFFLQNGLAQQKWKFTDTKIERLRVAFASKQSRERKWLQQGKSVSNLPKNS